MPRERIPALNMHFLLVYLSVTFHIPGFIVVYCPHVDLIVRIKNNCLIKDNTHVDTPSFLFLPLIGLVLYLQTWQHLNFE